MVAPQRRQGGDGPSFLDVSGGFRLSPDEDYDLDAIMEDDSESSESWRQSRLTLDSTATTPWQFNMSAGPPGSDGMMSSFAFSEGGGILVGADRPVHTTPDAHFIAVLGDDEAMKGKLRHGRRRTELQSYLEPYRRSKATGIVHACISLTIAFCLIVYILTLLMFFTPWYNDSIQIWLFRKLYASLRDFGDDIDAKRDAVAFVYLVSGGLGPTIVASVLWIAFANRVHSSRTPSLPRLRQSLRRKPRLSVPVLCRPAGQPRRWRSVILDATIGEIVVMAILCMMNAFIFIHVLLRGLTKTPTSTDRIIRVLGRAFGYNCLFTMVWLLLPVTKQSVWLECIGVSFPAGVKYHRWLGLLVVGYACLHGLCYAINFVLRDEATSQLLPSWGAMYKTSLIRDANGINAFGELALVALVVLSVAALPVVRRKCYTVFTYLHQIGASVCVLALCVHYRPAIWWLLPALVLFSTQKVIAWVHRRYPVEVVDMAPLPNGITRLVLRCQYTVQFVPGQFMYLNLPQLSWSQWHPMTVTSSPSRSPGLLTCYIKTARPMRTSWTSSLHDLAKVAYATQEPPRVHVDGFYGPTRSYYYEQYPCLVLIAGGMGIVQVLSILEELYHQARVALNEENQECFGDHDSVCSWNKQVWLLWTSRDLCLFKEFEELFVRIRALDPRETHFHLRFFLTKMPPIDALRYRPLAPCAFGHNVLSSMLSSPGLPKTFKRPLQSNGDRTTVVTTVGSMPTQRTCCWSARRFQPALSNGSLRAFTLVVVFGAVLAIAIPVEWRALHATHDDQLQHSAGNATRRPGRDGVFRPLHRLSSVVLVLLGCMVATVAALLHDMLRLHWPGQDHGPIDWGNDSSSHAGDALMVQSEPKPTDEPRETTVPIRGHSLASNSRLDLDSSGGPGISSLQRSMLGQGDILERLKILSFRPDLDKFMLTVAMSFPRLYGTIGVMASGQQDFVRSVEMSSITIHEDVNVDVSIVFHHAIGFHA